MQERAHAEAAPDEEEDHGDGGREVVEDGLAAVAERLADSEMAAVGGRPRAPAGPRRAGWPGPPPPTRRTPARAGVGPVHDVEARASGVAPGATIGMRRCGSVWCPVEDHAAGQRAVGHLALAPSPRPGPAARTTLPGSWLACTAARSSAGEAPETPMGASRWRRSRRRRSRGWPAMASGATRQVIRMERSRSRRRSSLTVMTRINRAALSRSGSRRRPRGSAHAPRLR
jgi:hypothetical protein